MPPKLTTQQRRERIELQIIKGVDDLEKQDKLTLLKMLHKKCIKTVECNDGTRVNLSGLSKKELAMISRYIKNRVEYNQMIATLI